MSLYRAEPATGTVSIYKQETGKDWCNFLWNEGGFQCEITHTGASSSKFVSATAEAIVLNEPKSGVVAAGRALYPSENFAAATGRRSVPSVPNAAA